jgi:hypothetical protein
MKAVLIILAIALVSVAYAQGKPTSQECKEDPRRAGCQK